MTSGYRSGQMIVKPRRSNLKPPIISRALSIVYAGHDARTGSQQIQRKIDAT